MTVLTLTDNASDFARELLSGGAVPEEGEDAAGHIAVATVHDIDYILTWNFPHIANTVTIPAIAEVCEQQGYSSPITTTPSQLKEVPLTLEDEVMKELHQIRAQIASEHDNDHQKLNAFYQGLRFPGFSYGIPGRTFQTEEELDRHIEESNREFERQEGS
ncbi:MAG: type II toxin-antitoxin system VapC family toxin [Dehalococcoidia bacterium]|nr:type II toxin-antitoxin system VapC family toxin [Dehalococcoidia bacterium]